MGGEGRREGTVMAVGGMDTPAVNDDNVTVADNTLSA